MSEQQSQTVTAVQERPAPQGYPSWRAFWQSRGLRWRTEPEIDEERQRYLDQRRAIAPNMEQGDYPFKGISLTRADVEWLLVTNDGGRGPVFWDVEQDKNDEDRRLGLDLRGADLRGVDLSNIPLARLRGGFDLSKWESGRYQLRLNDAAEAAKRARTDPASTQPRDMESAAIHLEGADLTFAHLEDAKLVGAHLERADLSNAYLTRDDLRFVHLEEANLDAAQLDWTWATNAHLKKANLGIVPGGGTNLEHADFSGADLEGAHLEAAKGRARFVGANLAGASLGVAELQHTDFAEAHLEGAELTSGHFEGAGFMDAHLDGVSFRHAHLEGASLSRAHLEGADLSDAHLEGADLREASFDKASRLNGTRLDRAYLDQTVFDRTNLAVVDWSAVHALGDEGGSFRVVLTRASFTGETSVESATRAYRQLASALREQALNEEADRFAYRAQRLQRVVYRRKRRLLRYFGSLILDRVSGYGYRPMRSFIAYVVVILTFAGVYLFLGNANGIPLQWNEAIVISMTAFHGRGFFSTVFQPGDVQAAVAAVEAFIGLLIEIVFIATFTNRFFAR